MSAELPSEVRTRLSQLTTWHFRLPVHHFAPLTGRTVEAEALLYGELGYADETLFLYGYCVGADEYCFLYDTPWDEVHRALNGASPNEWYDGLVMPRAFRVRYSVSAPERHEMVDPLLRSMMERPFRYLGTRAAVPRPLTATAEEVLRDIDLWDERLRYLRRGRYLVPQDVSQTAEWTPAVARFGGLVGRGDAEYAHYRYEVGGTSYVFAVKTVPPISRMTPSDHSPQASRKRRRAHLALARRQEQGFRLLSSGQEIGVRFNPKEPAEHVLGAPMLPAGAPPLDIDPSTSVYQLEPIVFPRSK
ncbi:DUF3592 domain-containing protein [Pyxidicoccus caerfyrddinensis]|uniref:DUF3592 domain-containing protein n=2 Tax=Pyxidicoccus caerfyrddinensis TaxID=2709663 RepID=UPI0013D941ED|nr:hypothetical protein [Pyxidicoccus caerfyrddinensis]